MVFVRKEDNKLVWGHFTEIEIASINISGISKQCSEGQCSAHFRYLRIVGPNLFVRASLLSGYVQSGPKRISFPDSTVSVPEFIILFIVRYFSFFAKSAGGSKKMNL